MEGLVGVRDERDEHTEHHVDEEGDEDIEVDLGEDPGREGHPVHLNVRVEHVVPVEEGEQALRRGGRVPELKGGGGGGGGLT